MKNFILSIIFIFIGINSNISLAASEINVTKFSTERHNQRIVGGQEVVPFSYPFMGSLQYDNNHYCGASLIGPNLVLTASHCVEGSDADGRMTVKFGGHDLTNASQWQTYTVSKIIMHEVYDGVSLNNDIAILELSTNVEGILPIKLADAAIKESLAIDKHLTVMGWGTLESGGESPDVLHEVVVDHISNEICNDSEHYDGGISNTMICAGFENGGKDSCQGDSGGPLIVSRDNGFYQVGIVSWGRGCAEPAQPGVYADVEALLGWAYSNAFGTGFDTERFNYYLLGNPEQTILTKFKNGLNEELDITDIVITHEEVGVTISSNSCNNSTIQPGQFCEIEVQISDVVNNGSFILTSSISSQNLPVFSKKISYEIIPKSESDMSAHMSIPASVEWYTGGDEKWLAEDKLFEDGEKPVLRSGFIGHDSKTILMAEIRSDRFSEFSFDYLPSMEDGYDFLTVYHNEKEIISVSGVNEEFENFHIDLEEGTDLIMFKYEKDGGSTGGDDNVILKSLDFSVENESPILSVLESDISVRSELEFILDASPSSDPDGDEVYFSWVDLSQENIVISTDALVTMKAPRVEEDTIVNYEIIVIDKFGGKSTEQVIVNILKNEAPNVTLTTNVSSAARGDTIIFDASASNDPEGDALTYSWVQTGDAFVVVSNASSTLEFVAP